jgi:hypothetical protein
MSVDPVGNLESPAVEEPKKKSRVKIVSAKTGVRKHLLTTAYKQDVAEKLDKLHAAGHTIVSITTSPDIRGFEVVSYSEE